MIDQLKENREQLKKPREKRHPKDVHTIKRNDAFAQTFSRVVTIRFMGSGIQFPLSDGSTLPSASSTVHKTSSSRSAGTPSALTNAGPSTATIYGANLSR